MTELGIRVEKDQDGIGDFKVFLFMPSTPKRVLCGYIRQQRDGDSSGKWVYTVLPITNDSPPVMHAAVFFTVHAAARYCAEKAVGECSIFVGRQVIAQIEA